MPHTESALATRPAPIGPADAASTSTNTGRLAHIVWFAVVAIFSTVTLIGAALSEQPEGQCTGIGWGCTVSGPDLALLIAIFAGPFVVASWIGGHGLIALIRLVCRG